MKKKITITYEWWNNDEHNDVGHIPTSHQQELEEVAESRIKEMMAEGYTSGELLHTESEDLIDYKGFWERTTETVE